MAPDARVLALGAAAVLGSLTLHWLGRRRHGARQHHRRSHATRLVQRGQPLVAGPDQVSLVSYNILCERWACCCSVWQPLLRDAPAAAAACGTAACAPVPTSPAAARRYANARRLPHVFAQYLDPDYRWQRLRIELESFGADVVALQEVTVDK